MQFALRTALGRLPTLWPSATGTQHLQAARNLSSFLSSTRSSIPKAPLLRPTVESFQPLVSPSNHVGNFGQRRFAVANFRPRRLKYKKAQKGFFPSRSGGSLRGTTVYHGDYGLQVTEGGRLSDKQLDVARTAVRRTIKIEKGARFFLRCFPDRPVTSKGAETRMGKGKGAVDYFATWVAAGRVVIEVKGVRKELAEKALRVAASMLPLRTKIIEAHSGSRVPPRVLPHFVRKRLAQKEFMEFDADRASRQLPATTGPTGSKRA